MKMSKSIKDYKEAMDNIKISESFYKRTETLLTELPETQAEKNPAGGIKRHITAIAMSAAACLVCVLGIRLAAGSRTGGITETVTAADGEISVTETGKEADELIDELDEYDDGGIVAESIEALIEESAETVVPVPANPCSDDPQTAAAPTGANSEASSETTAVTTEKRVVQGIDPNAHSGENETVEEPNGADFDEAPAAEPVPNPGASGYTEEVEFDDAEEDDVPITESGGTDTGAGAAETEKTPLFSDLTLDHTTVDVTPYFDMNGVKSGETVIQKSGTDFKPVLDLIAGMDEYATRIGNSSFTSVFSVRIYNDNIDLDLYSIYLTNYESIVITKHSPDGSQVRETYALRREYYEDIRHWLFLLFGGEEDYELFLNLIGGK